MNSRRQAHKFSLIASRCDSSALERYESRKRDKKRENEKKKFLMQKATRKVFVSLVAFVAFVLRALG